MNYKKILNLILGLILITSSFSSFAIPADIYNNSSNLCLTTNNNNSSNKPEIDLCYILQAINRDLTKGVLTLNKNLKTNMVEYLNVNAHTVNPKIKDKIFIKTLDFIFTPNWRNYAFGISPQQNKKITREEFKRRFDLLKINLADGVGIIPDLIKNLKDKNGNILPNQFKTLDKNISDFFESYKHLNNFSKTKYSFLSWGIYQLSIFIFSLIITIIMLFKFAIGFIIHILEGFVNSLVTIGIASSQNKIGEGLGKEFAANLFNPSNENALTFTTISRFILGILAVVPIFNGYNIICIILFNTILISNVISDRASVALVETILIKPISSSLIRDSQGSILRISATASTDYNDEELYSNDINKGATSKKKLAIISKLANDTINFSFRNFKKITFSKFFIQSFDKKRTGVNKEIKLNPNNFTEYIKQIYHNKYPNGNWIVNLSNNSDSFLKFLVILDFYKNLGMTSPFETFLANNSMMMVNNVEENNAVLKSNNYNIKLNQKNQRNNNQPVVSSNIDFELLRTNSNRNLTENLSSIVNGINNNIKNKEHVVIKSLIKILSNSEKINSIERKLFNDRKVSPYISMTEMVLLSKKKLPLEIYDNKNNSGLFYPAVIYNDACYKQTQIPNNNFMNCYQTSNEIKAKEVLINKIILNKLATIITISDMRDIVTSKRLISIKDTITSKRPILYSSLGKNWVLKIKSLISDIVVLQKKITKNIFLTEINKLIHDGKINGDFKSYEISSEDRKKEINTILKPLKQDGWLALGILYFNIINEVNKQILNDNKNTNNNIKSKIIKKLKIKEFYEFKYKYVKSSFKYINLFIFKPSIRRILTPSNYYDELNYRSKLVGMVGNIIYGFIYNFMHEPFSYRLLNKENLNLNLTHNIIKIKKELNDFNKKNKNNSNNKSDTAINLSRLHDGLVPVSFKNVKKFNILSIKDRLNLDNLSLIEPVSFLVNAGEKLSYNLINIGLDIFKYTIAAIGTSVVSNIISIIPIFGKIMKVFTEILDGLIYLVMGIGVVFIIIGTSILIKSLHLAMTPILTWFIAFMTLIIEIVLIPFSVMLWIISTSSLKGNDLFSSSDTNTKGYLHLFHPLIKIPFLIISFVIIIFVSTILFSVFLHFYPLAFNGGDILQSFNSISKYNPESTTTRIFMYLIQQTVYILLFFHISTSMIMNLYNFIIQELPDMISENLGINKIGAGINNSMARTVAEAQSSFSSSVGQLQAFLGASSSLGGLTKIGVKSPPRP